MIPPLKLSARSIKAPILAARANYVRSRRAASTSIIAVTGSSGKTTTTELIGRVLSECGNTAAYSGHNTLKAIQKNLLHIRPDRAFHVQEVSGGRPGAAAEIAAVLKPDIAVVTVVAPEHLKQFRSVDAIAAGKAALVASLPAEGLAILNADDVRVSAMRTRTSARVATFGFSNSADLRCMAISNEFPSGMTLHLAYRGETFEVSTQLIGAHWVPSVLAGALTGLMAGITPQACAHAIASYQPKFGRCSLHAIAGGPTFVNDAYKAPAWSMDAFLSLIEGTPAELKTLVLGMVSDNTKDNRQFYRGIVRKALSCSRRVVVVGAPARYVEKMLSPELGNRLSLFQTTLEVRRFLAANSVPGEVIFLKSNRSSHLERILLDWSEPISCWMEHCGRKKGCLECNRLRRSSTESWLARWVHPTTV